ncbi:Cation efflux system protein CusB [Alphaproteobacteria bacterium SO-S41]|nr:Cation efflux system protein CusB [Alphaproteobacteria bacterium SO-S41]
MPHFMLRARRACLTGVFAAAFTLASAAAEEPGHDDHGGEHTEGEAAPRIFSAEEMAAAGIVVAPVQRQPLPRLYRAPGEVVLNDYTTSIVSARVAGVVTRRYAALGSTVKAGDPLLRLLSSGMAEAQSAFALAHQEYARLTGAGRNAVTRKETEQAFIALREARVRLQTYGLTADDIAALERRGLSDVGIGEFDIRAPQDGVLVSDAYRLGELAEAGKKLAQISDGKTVWVEARVAPAVAALLEGHHAAVTFGEMRIDARLLQIFPTVDEDTRTVRVRLQADDTAQVLLPGAFVGAELHGAAEPVLAVPPEAVLRSADGDWAVQVERSPGQFEAVEIEVLYTVGALTAIEGIAEGTRIAVKGAFFIAAESAKGGFDAHAH